MWKLIKDERGAIAIEFALIAPLALAILGYGVNIGQLLQVRSATQFAAMSAASSGARALNQQAGAIANAQTIAQTTFTANAPLFLKNTTAVFGGCTGFDASGSETTDDTLAFSLSCRVDASAPALFAIGWTTVSQTAEARS